MSFIALPKRLRDFGLLGINQRNADFIMRHNQRKLYPLVDNKLHTKRLALAQGIAVPELYGVIEAQYQTKTISEILGKHRDFVIKPAHGSGGNGILVITGCMGDYFQKANGELLSLDSIRHHISNILSGTYSLSGVADQAIIEYRVKFDPVFEDISYRGVPDIRVIVFRGVPVAAMMRLPTRLSDGKANLHQGAMGMGIDLATGISCGGVLRNQPCTVHPDTRESIMGITIPHWNNILHLATQCADTVQLGYLGADIVMDRELGPLMLELNARPGLSVQLANQRGLLDNLQAIEALKFIPEDVNARVALSQQLSSQHPNAGGVENPASVETP
ncbi:MAG: alpha-L-glutamate ligase-like protein [Porticoccaceae bacterium]|nr:alpha-L-glutamate ligase-like protein [Porticoccaceae bacterium]